MLPMPVAMDTRRTRSEEQAMRAEFGAAYYRYAAQTPRVSFGLERKVETTGSMP